LNGFRENRKGFCVAESSEDFDRFAASIKDAAKETGALIVNSLLDTPDRPSIPNVDLGLDAMLAVIRHVRPRVIYLIESCFDLEDEVSDLSEEDEEDEEETEGKERHPALEKLVRKWGKHDGKPCVAFAGFVTDGILHTALARPDWRDEFADELDAIKDDIEIQLGSERENIRLRDSQEVRDKAELLAKHPSFSAGRISFEKRLFLAQHLFSGLDPEQISAITRRAENLDWLNKSGFRG
jgi:hypothetical protein